MQHLRFFIACLCAAAIASAQGATAATNATTCSSSTACVTFQNTSSGSAANFQGTSGYGSRGTSKQGAGLKGKSGSGSMLHPGVEGESTNNTGSDVAGGFGLNGVTGTAPAYGVYALGSAIAAYGGTTDTAMYSSSTGVYGVDEAQPKSSVDQNVGVYGLTRNAGIAVLAVDGPMPTTKPQGPIGVYASGRDYGVFAQSDDGFPFYAADRSSDDVGIGEEDYFLQGYGSSNNADYVMLDDQGNEKISGSMLTKYGSYVRTRGSNGIDTLSYGTRSTSPIMEDDREARLVNGSAFVALDRDLAAVIDRSTDYLVFLTAEGDDNGLYVASRTAAGFTVREQQGGRSNVAFHYRLVARPQGNHAARLARVARDEPPLRARATTPTPHADALLSPLKRLEQRLGPKRYAAELRTFLEQQKEK